jgi:hypothetical protein
MLLLFEIFSRLAVCGLKNLVRVLSIVLACDMVTTNHSREKIQALQEKIQRVQMFVSLTFYGHGECYF